MKTMNSLLKKLALLLLLCINLWFLQGAKAFSQIANGALIKKEHLHTCTDDSCTHEHEHDHDIAPFYKINLSDSLVRKDEMVTKFELTKEGDTIYHYSYKAFNMGDNRYDGPVLLSNADKALRNTVEFGKTTEMKPMAQLKAVSQSNSVGRIGFSEGITPSGGKTYSVPILTATVASSAPEVALVYNSQAGNGVAGYGWGLSGISGILVSGKSIYYDGTAGPFDPAKPDDCTFFLDGTRLVANTGSLTEYHYETAQGFILVKKHMSGSNIAYFTVAYPDGSTATYGFTNNTSMKHVYPVTQIKDLKGYIITYEYEDFIESGNNYYIKSIKYGGKTAATHLAELRFSYVTRTDFATAYTGGVTISSKKLLKSISSYNSVNATSELRTYNLTHVLNNVQQLTQVDCKTGNLFLNPLQFAYEYYYPGSQGGLTKETSLFLSSYFASGSDAKPIYVRGKFVKNRFNDGLITFPGKFSTYGKTGEKVTTFLGIVTGKYPIFGSTFPADQSILIAPGLSFFSETKTITAEGGFQTISATDVNGDGVDEIVKVNFNGISSDKTILKITKYSLSNGSTLSSTSFNVQVTGVVNSGSDTYSPISRSYYFGDFSGTGKTQLLTVSHNKDFLNKDRTSYFALINLETGALIRETTLFSHSTYDQDYIMPIDVNGDGKTELCYGTTSGWSIYNINSTSFTTLPFTTSLTRSDLYKNELVGDLNGDGMADILVPPANSYQDKIYAYIPVWAPSYCNNCGTSYPIIDDYSTYCRKCQRDVSSYISLYSLYCNDCYSSLNSCSYGYGTPSSIHDACCPYHGSLVYKEIDNGYMNNGNTWTVYLSTGKGHVKSTQSVMNVEAGETYYLMDVNGDGKSDLLQLKNSRVKTFLNKNGIVQSTATGSDVAVNSKAKILPTNDNASHFITIEDAYVNCFRFTKDEGKDKLLTKLTDSYGLQFVNGYSNMVENDNYIASSTTRYYPYFSVSAPINLLRSSNIYTDNYQSIKQYYYTWYGGVMHRTGLGFCGFEKVKTIEYVENITTEEERNPEMFGVATKTDSPYNTTYFYYYRNEGSNKKCNPQMTSTSSTDKLTGVYTSASYQYDVYNNPTKITQNIGSGSGITQVTDQTYDNLATSARYLLGQPLVKTVTNTRGGASWIDKEAITYNASRLPATRITYTGTGGNQKTGETRWDYYDNGNVKSELSAPYNVTEFLGNTYSYDASGRYLASVTNAFSQTTAYSQYDKYGNPKTVSDYKNRVTTQNYNEWGQLTSIAYSDGTTESAVINWGGTGLYTVTNTVTGSPATVVHYDALGREVRGGNLRFDGQWQYVDKAYDSKGRLEKVSMPFKGASPSSWNNYTYDTFHRPTKLTESSGKTTTWSYSGLSILETKDGVATTKILDASGTLVGVTDPGGTITYALRPDGQPSSITAPGGVVTSFGYDAYGRRTSITDPSAGTQTFSDVYTTAGVLTRTVKDANNKTIARTYDKYGRVSGINRPEFNTTYTYNSDGLLVNETSTNNTSKVFTYDSQGRPATTRENAPDGKWLQRTYAYSGGNISSVQYDSQSGALGTENFVYANGHNTEIKLGTTSIWKLTEENALGQPTQVKTGEMNRTYTYTPYGMSTGRKAGNIQNFKNDFDLATGNLKSRKDSTRNITETFGYDNLNRLTNAAGKAIAYSANGNITSITGVGTMEYTRNDNPYQVSLVTPTGGSVPVREQTVTYTSFQRPATLAENGYNTTFTYNVDGDRVKMHLTQGSTAVLTRYYIGGQYEIDVQSNTERLYLGGDAYSAPVVYIKEGSSWKIYYICRDYLGSITHVANADGSLKHEYSYDAWGRLRNPATQVAYTPGSEPALFLGRGYTGHEHLPWFGLVNMNARLYDPALGRFLSPDAYVQMPDFTQNFNRYSYCLNNPLVYVDLSGENIFKWLFYDFMTGGAISLTLMVTIPNTLFTVTATGITLYTTVIPVEHASIYLQSFTDTSGAGKRFQNSLLIDNGMFKGKFWQVVSRWTWEFPQAILGLSYTHYRNMVGNVDRVDYFDGATFATNENSKKHSGITLGNYINMDIEGKIDHDFVTFITKHDPMYMHEYGHYLDSQVLGLSYLFVVGVPSLFSAQFSGEVDNTYNGKTYSQREHKFRWYERSANKRAAKYFKNNYDVNWDTDIYEKQPYEYRYPRKDRR